MRRRRGLRGVRAIYGLFLFFAMHRTLISAILCTGAVLTAVPMFRSRRAVGAVGVLTAALVLALANGLVSGDLVNALVYEQGPVGPGPASGAEACGSLAQGVLRASSGIAGQPSPDQHPEYAAAVQAYLADGCGGDARDLRSLRQVLSANDGAHF
jgi:hypothetical protein